MRPLNGVPIAGCRLLEPSHCIGKLIDLSYVQRSLDFVSKTAQLQPQRPFLGYLMITSGSQNAPATEPQQSMNLCGSWRRTRVVGIEWLVAAKLDASKPIQCLPGKFTCNECKI